MVPGSGTKLIVESELVKREIEIRVYLDYSMSVIVGSRAARRARRPQAGAPAHPLHDVRARQPDLRPFPTKSPPTYRRRRAGQLSPARRRLRLRRHGASGAGFLACAIRWSTARATSARSTAIPPAAYRYTEARMSKDLPSRCCATSTRRPIDWDAQLRRDEARSRSVLPCALPELARATAASGIAVGMATNIPPHNLCEVVDGLRLHD
jgi:hypothetical protein